MEKLLDVESYRFSEGYSYAESQIAEKLERNLEMHYSRSGEKLKVSLADTEVEISGGGRL